MENHQRQYPTAKVVDLFCGVGGLTHGFIRESFEVVAGYDFDESCRYAYEVNNDTQFIAKNVIDITGDEITEKFVGAGIKILIGCAPCQPFSTYSYKNQDQKKINLLLEFARLIEEVQPDIVSMENVPRLAEYTQTPVFEGFADVVDSPIFDQFLAVLGKNGYFFKHYIVNCPEYGIPQYRRRLVLLASKYAEIDLIPKTHTEANYITVADAIGNMEPLESGQISKTDILHRASKLSELNLERIKQSKPGGTWKDWDEGLRLKCHLKETGQTYVSVYGRMSWDKPAPTMTTHCTGIGNGRFGHPVQNRSITLREAAILQTFPKTYKFAENSSFKVKTISTQIGNAVPVLLGQVIAKSIRKHISEVFITK